MVKSDRAQSKEGSHKSNITADVIVLGCSLPGIVTAHQLKKKFGDTMDIVVLDLSATTRVTSRCNVAFQGVDEFDSKTEFGDNVTTEYIVNNISRRYLIKFAKDFDIPLPDAIVAPQKDKSSLNKLFQHGNGSTVQCSDGYHDFSFLSFIERFELNQYQSFLDANMVELFLSERTTDNTKSLLYFDRTSMEEHIRNALLFSTTREIMRLTVRLVCGASAETVSVLFYLHQCYRTSGSRNHLDGANTKLREKLLGYCRKRLANTLQKSIEDITMPAKSIREIRTYSDERVILETMKGEDNYVCNLLAMALKPDELHDIRVDSRLLVDREYKVVDSMTPGKAKKFFVQYEENFWRRDGYSGDILSVRGPILWAMERPKLSTTGSTEKYASLVGYLKVKDNIENSKDAALEQLVKLFGEEAARPVVYTETDVEDIFIPRRGDYVALRRMTEFGTPRHLSWGALDIFGDGDIAAALEAGHVTYLHLLRSLRPQAQTYDDVSVAEHPTILGESRFSRCLTQVNYMNCLRLTAYTTVAYVGYKLVKSYFVRK